MDTNILFSIINTKLRDNYSNLDDLCYDEDINKDELLSILKLKGYIFNEELNKFEYGQN